MCVNFTWFPDSAQLVQLSPFVLQTKPHNHKTFPPIVVFGFLVISTQAGTSYCIRINHIYLSGLDQISQFTCVLTHSLRLYYLAPPTSSSGIRVFQRTSVFQLKPCIKMGRVQKMKTPTERRGASLLCFIRIDGM